MEGDLRLLLCLQTVKISIHALRVEGDMYAAYLYRRRREISIHALRVEGDHGKREGNEGKRTISIHALRVEGDQPHCCHQ